MYFKKLELVGFKSFCDKTTLQFEPGVTAIVGPNGCGKSNVFDSIRWVLGEQSAKSLRGSEMQDVIFNGADQKDPVGMAEVALTFDNNARFFNIDAGEVIVTRRLFRSGESEYLLNKSPVRLKDITDLFAGTGIGAESYSIVAQGKIDLILSSRPEDRRLVFDEASGITRYKVQKRETMRKLEETEQNLSRVNDIIVEVRRQIGSLERQANKARKYREFFDALKNKEIQFAVLERERLLKEKKELADEIGKVQARAAQSQDLLRAQEEESAGSRRMLKEIEEEVMSVKQELMTLENAIVRDDEHARISRERRAEFQENVRRCGLQAAELKTKLALDEEKLSAMRAEYGGIKSAMDEKRAALAEKEMLINELAHAVKSSLDSAGLAKKEILNIAARIAGANNDVTDMSSKHQMHQHRRRRLDIERARIDEEETVSAQSLNAVTDEVQRLKLDLSGFMDKKAGIKAEVDSEVAALNVMAAGIERVERERLTLESHKEFLSKLVTKYEDISESLEAVIYLDRLPAEAVSGFVVKIKEDILPDGQTQDSHDDAVRRRVRLYGEAKPFELDTHRIEEKIAKLDRDIDALRLERGVKEGRIQELNQLLDYYDQEIRNQELTLANKETSRQTTLEQFNRIQDEHNVIIVELADVTREISTLENNLQTRKREADDLNQQRLCLEDSIARDESEVSRAGREREEMLVACAKVKGELDGLRQRMSSDEATLKLLEDAYSRDTTVLGEAARQIEESQVKKTASEKEIRDAEERIARAKEKNISLRETLRTAEEKYLAVSEAARTAEARIEGMREELAGLQNLAYDLQMKDKDVDYKYLSIKERMQQGYKVDIDGITEIPEGAAPPVADAGVNAGAPAVLEAAIAELKSKVDSCGSVNLVAIEEYDELKQRYDFLTRQQEDLTGAKNSLHQAIQKINCATRRMFLETFEKVREEFKNYFRMLFNGGEAQVFLTDENDPLESGIEIICRPPGKKLQNVLLLSGGEKSLSAIALIFAIFKVKPSPFCVLDEIDAALDEANVDRLGKMLQEFARDSQFIVITHNKRTIANADVMYGITMQQSGISRIVSVKFGGNTGAAPEEMSPQQQPESVPETV